MERYSATEKNEITPFVATRMNLEMIIPSEVNQTEKDKYHMILLLCGLLRKKDTNELIYKTDVENKLIVTKGGRGRGKLGVCD